MKYWDCINVPGKTDVEGATSAPSLADTTVLSVGNVEPNMVEAVKKAAEESEPVQVVANNVMSQSYLDMRAAAFGTTPTTVPEETTVEDTEYTPEELDAKQGYISVDEVDISQFDTDGKFEVPEVDKAPDDMIVEVSHPTEDTVMVTETRIPENSEDVSEKSFDKNALLESIFSNGGEEFATSIAEKVVEKVVETPEPGEVEYALDEEKYGEIIDTLNKYEEEYFKEIPIKHISNRFLRNISKAVFRAHENAVIKYEDPPLMDPIFLLYPLTTEDPYMAMGKFWSIVTEKISNNRSWTSAISKSVDEYEEYMRMEAEEKDDETDEGNGVESNNE